jgi:hypothetical protein
MKKTFTLSLLTALSLINVSLATEKEEQVTSTSKLHIHFLNGGTCDFTEALEGKTAFAKTVYGKPAPSQFRLHGPITLDNQSAGNKSALQIDALTTEYTLSFPIKLGDKIVLNGNIHALDRQKGTWKPDSFTVYANLLFQKDSLDSSSVAHLAIDMSGIDGKCIVVGAYTVDPVALEKTIQSDRDLKLAYLKEHPPVKDQGISTRAQVAIPYNID